MLDTIHAQSDGLHNATDGGPDGPQGVDGRPSGANQTAVLQEYCPDDPLLSQWDNAGSKVQVSDEDEEPDYPIPGDED
jgi:hypothetical protein